MSAGRQWSEGEVHAAVAAYGWKALDKIAAHLQRKGYEVELRLYKQRVPTEDDRP